MGYRNEFRGYEREYRWTFWRVAFFVAFASIVLGAVGYGLGWFSEAGQVAREEFGPRGGLAKYEWFRDKHEAIGSVKTKVRLAREERDAFLEAAGPRESWTFEDKQEASRLSAVHSATRNILAEMVAEYNANSKKFNHSQFRAADLPYTETEE